MDSPLPDGSPSTSARAWALLLQNRLHYSSVVLSSFAFGLFLPFMREDLQLTYLQIGLLQGVWWITSAAALVPMSVVLGKLNPNWRVAGILLLITPFVMAQGLATGFWTLLMARFCTVLTYAALAPVRPLLLKYWAAPRDYSRVTAAGLSTHSTLMAAVITFSPLIIIGLGSWRLAYFIQGGLMALHLLVWSMLALARPSTPVSQAAVAASPLPSVSGGSTPVRALLTYPHAWLLGVVMLCLSASWTTVLTFLPTILEEERGIAISSGGILFGFLYYALIPGGFFGSKVFRNITNRRMMVLLPAMGNTVFTFAALLAGNTVMAALALTGLGLVWVFVSAMEVLPFEFNNINEREVSVLAALVLTLGAVGFGAGPVLAGLVAQITGSLLTGVFSVAALTGLAIVAAAFFPRFPGAVALRSRTSMSVAS